MVHNVMLYKRAPREIFDFMGPAERKEKPVKQAMATMICVVLMMLMPGMASGAETLSERQVERIERMVPEEAPAKPEKARKLLVFSLCKGFYHDVIPAGQAAFVAMGEKTGAFEAVVSDDIAQFEPENLKHYDAVLFNNSTGELFMPPNDVLEKMSDEEKQKAEAYDALLKKSLLDFVKSGKGIVGIHAATDAFYQWPAYGEMMGGYFDGHPWNERVGIKLDEPKHPLNAAFKGENFLIVDEIYQFRDYSRKTHRVLLSLDPENTDMTKDGIKREDKDFAISMVREYEGGRVFYCALGHRHSIFSNRPVLEHMLAGIQFALGDLEADATPSQE
jgi:type 1 glutamine amidotransferase